MVHKESDWIGKQPTPDLSFLACVSLFWGVIRLANQVQKQLPLCKKIFQPPWARDIDFRNQILSDNRR